MRAIDELILKQAVYLRQCYSDFAETSTDLATAKNNFDQVDADAGAMLISNEPINDKNNKPLKLTNDVGRKAYVKARCVVQTKLYNVAKEAKERAAKRIDVEISVLSAIKGIAAYEKVDDQLLANHDIAHGMELIADEKKKELT